MALALLAVAWLLTYLLHSTILLGGAWLLSAARVVRSPIAKDTLWKVCLVGGLVTATVQTAYPLEGLGRRYWLPGSVEQAQLTTAASMAPATSAAEPAAPIAEPSVASPRARVPALSLPYTPQAARGFSRAPIAASATTTTHNPRPTNRPSWEMILLGVWILGAAACLARLAYRRLRFCRRLGDRRELADGALVEMLDALREAAGLRRRVRLAISPELSGPVAMGATEICLPERVLTSLAPAEQRAVLAHELGHLVRRDPTWLAVGVVLENLLFVQPLNRVARRRVQEAAEYLCDDWAAMQTGGGLTLAKCLAEVATWLQASRQAVPVSGMAENRSQLVARVQRLLDGVEPRAARGLRLAVPVAALALSTVAFAAPGVLPPCQDDGRAAAVVAAPRGHEAMAVMQGGPHVWATIRDGRVVTFRSGFAPRMTGQGRIGIRRGGRAVELMDDQHLTVNGAQVDEDEDVAVCDTDTLRIVDEDGRTVWSLEPVRVPAVEGVRAGDSDDDWSDAAAVADSAASIVADLADAGDVAASSRELARAGNRLGREIQAEIAPDVAQLQRLGERMATKVAPQIARLGVSLGVSIAAGIGPAIARAFGDMDCDRCDAPDSTGRRHRGIDGSKRLRP